MTERLRHATLRQLQIFIIAGETSSFARAAEALHLTQPAVSMQMAQLSDAKANGTDKTGNGSIALSNVSSHPCVKYILIPKTASLRHTPKAGAVCGNSVRTDLRGVRRVTSVPTATPFKPSTVSPRQPPRIRG
jgi:hypothetical protein